MHTECLFLHQLSNRENLRHSLSIDVVKIDSVDGKQF